MKYKITAKITFTLEVPETQSTHSRYHHMGIVEEAARQCVQTHLKNVPAFTDVITESITEIKE